MNKMFCFFLANSHASFFANVTASFTPLFNASSIVRSIICGIAASKSGRIPPDCIILDN